MRTGTKAKSVKQLSFDLLKQYDIHDFQKINYQSLKRITGIGDAKATSILAAIEFGKRVFSRKDED